MSRLPKELARQTEERIARLSADYRGEIPAQMHTGGVAQDGTPQWDPEFSRWISARGQIDTPRPETATGEERLRVTRALRRLRKEAVREFEVVYRVMVLGERIEDTTKWLNQRAERNRIPLPSGRTRNYRESDTVAILYSGVDKMCSLWL